MRSELPEEVDDVFKTFTKQNMALVAVVAMVALAGCSSGDEASDLTLAGPATSSAAADGSLPESDISVAPGAPAVSSPVVTADPVADGLESGSLVVDENSGAIVPSAEPTDPTAPPAELPAGFPSVLVPMPEQSTLVSATSFVDGEFASFELVLSSEVPPAELVGTFTSALTLAGFVVQFELSGEFDATVQTTSDSWSVSLSAYQVADGTRADMTVSATPAPVPPTTSAPTQTPAP